MRWFAIALIALAAVWVIAAVLLFLLPYVLAAVGVVFVFGLCQKLVSPDTGEPPQDKT